jgi:mannobiose 2-epimerase
VQGDPALSERVRQAALRLAEAVYKEGLDDDGSLFYESGPHGLANADKEWWTQAEAVVGFYNAYQISGQERFAQAADRCWTYIREKVVDRTHGDWFKRLRRDGTPNLASYKVGPWECPYHHARLCFEMLERLNHSG